MKKNIIVLIVLLVYLYVTKIEITNFTLTALLSVPIWILAYLLNLIGHIMGVKIFGHEVFYFRFLFLEYSNINGKKEIKRCPLYLDLYLNRQFAIRINDNKNFRFIYYIGEVVNFVAFLISLIVLIVFYPFNMEHIYFMLILMLYMVSNFGIALGGLILQLSNKKYSYFKAVSDENGLKAARSNFKINYNLATTKDIGDIDNKLFVYTSEYWNNYFESANYLLEVEKLICLKKYDEALEKIKSSNIEMNRNIKINLRHYELFILLVHLDDYDRAERLYKSKLIEGTFDSMDSCVLRNKILYENLVDKNNSNNIKNFKRLDYYCGLKQIGFRKIESNLNEILKEKISLIDWSSESKQDDSDEWIN